MATHSHARTAHSAATGDIAPFGAAVVLSIALSVSVVTACAQKLPRTHDSGVASDKTMSRLTDVERSRLCDWEAAWSGGYGAEHRCAPPFAVVANESRSSCEASLRNGYKSCSATVSDYERCTRDFWTNPCAGRGPIWSRPECVPMGACIKDALRAESHRSGK